MLTRRTSLAVIVNVILVFGFSSGASAQTSAPDLSGLWDGADNSSDLVQYVKSQGSEIPFTPAAKERYQKVDFATNPNGYCLPPGPSRAITGPSPFQIVQSPGVVAMLFENHGIYRIIYTDGTQHPADIQDYPQFMGHSIGKWEGDTLVVDTVGIHDRTWLDSNGLEHSLKLHLTERFQKVDANTIKYSTTFDDPAFFTKPWGFTLNLVRQKKDDRLLEYVCEENEKDRATLKPTTRE